MEKAGVRYWLVMDHLGSVRLVVDATTGAVAQRRDHDGYGRMVTNTSPGFQPFGYTGGLQDELTELVSFGIRDYHANTGQFTSKDLILFPSGPVQSLVGGRPGQSWTRTDSRWAVLEWHDDSELSLVNRTRRECPAPS